MTPRAWSLAAVVAAAGCASSGSGTAGRQGVPVISNPTGATATAGDQRITTPGTLYVPKGAREMEIYIEMPGFETAVVLLTAESGSMRDCIDRATLSPDKPSSEKETGNPGVAISGAVNKALADCQKETAERLEPATVFVKLVPAAEAGSPR